MRIGLKVLKRGADTDKWLRKLQNKDYLSILESCGQRGVNALEKATPKRTGKTASSWSYRVIRTGKKSSIEWYNSNVTNNGIPVAILIQYDHGTGTGGFVAGRDYINPAMKDVFDSISEEVWKVAMRS